VGERWPGAPRCARPFPGGAGLLDREARRAWILVDDGSARSLGAALAWSGSHGAADVDLIVGTAPEPHLPGVLARRAQPFAAPPGVWALRGRELEAAAPAPCPPPPPVPDGAWEAAGALGLLGLEVVVEAGVVRGEVLGLEVARVVPAGGGWRLDVGVGAHDRAALAELRPGEDPIVALERAVAAVRRYRRPDVVRHPANTLARERWLRAALVAHPDLVGASELGPVEPTVPRRDLLAPSPAPAVGRDGTGRPVVAVASSGIDTDLVPSAADARECHAPGARLVVVVPGGDDHPVTRRLAASLAVPAEVVVAPAGWESLAA